MYTKDITRLIYQD